MIEMEGKKYQPQETYEGGLCIGCAFFLGEVDRHCNTVNKVHNCMPEGNSFWYIFKEVKEDGTGS